MRTADIIVTLYDGDQVHVQVEYDSETVSVPHVAWRPAPHGTWGPPLDTVEVRR